uniref:Phosphoglucomutase-1 n=1 Tax=Schistosoma haematobium TaxID=6185 RepID=A0A095B2Q8_SCHHA
MQCYEVPTGWKFFGNLMDAKLCSLCGEESFGTGSDHIREKDGLWALLAWLSILAKRSQIGLPVDVESIVMEHWKKYGRYFFTRYDYENCESSQGDEIMNELKKLIDNNRISGHVYTTVSGRQFVCDFCDNFSYVDPVDGSHTANQGFRLIFNDGTRFVYRLSGTGSSGATLRVYVDTYESDPAKHTIASQEYLKPHIELALELCGVTKITGRLPINSPSRRKSSKSSEVCLDSEHRTVHFNQMVNEDHLSSSNLSTTISSNLHPLHVARKVSFSDLPLVIITTEDKVIYGEDDDSGHHIEVRLLNRDIDEMPTLPSELKNKPVFEIKLGMLKQATVYRTEFTIPDDLKSGELEILRTVTEMDGHVGVPVNVGASFNLLSCEPIPSPGHAKGQGTPLLRSGIHRITENQDYIDSDDYTEWPGYVNTEDDDDQEEESCGVQKAKTTLVATENIDANQGDDNDDESP